MGPASVLWEYDANPRGDPGDDARNSEASVKSFLEEIQWPRVSESPFIVEKHDGSHATRGVRLENSSQTKFRYCTSGFSCVCSNCARERAAVIFERSTHGQEKREAGQESGKGSEESREVARRQALRLRAGLDSSRFSLRFRPGRRLRSGRKRISQVGCFWFLLPNKSSCGSTSDAFSSVCLIRRKHSAILARRRHPAGFSS